MHSAPSRVNLKPDDEFSKLIFWLKISEAAKTTLVPKLPNVPERDIKDIFLESLINCLD